MLEENKKHQNIIQRTWMEEAVDWPISDLENSWSYQVTKKLLESETRMHLVFIRSFFIHLLIMFYLHKNFLKRGSTQSRDSLSFFADGGSCFVDLVHAL